MDIQELNSQEESGQINTSNTQLQPCVDGHDSEQRKLDANKLIIAAKDGDLDYLELHMDEVDTVRDHESDASLLHLCAFFGHANCASVIAMAHPLLLDVKDNMGRTALFVACECGQENVVADLARRNTESVQGIDNAGETPLAIACKNGYHSVVSVLIQAHPRLLSDMLSRYHSCDLMNTQNPESADVLENRVMNPLLIACQFAHPSVARVLVETAPALIKWKNEFGQTPFYVAARKNSLELVILLSDTDPSTMSVADEDGLTPLSAACKRGHLSVVSFLIGKDPGLLRIADFCGRTPLHHACSGNNVDIVSLLVKNDPWLTRITDHSGRTPLFATVSRIHLLSTSALLIDLDHGSVRISDQKGETTLLRAYTSGNWEATTLLVHKDPELMHVPCYSVSTYSNTPFLFAAGDGSTEIIKLFLSMLPCQLSRDRAIQEALDGEIDNFEEFQSTVLSLPIIQWQRQLGLQEEYLSVTHVLNIHHAAEIYSSGACLLPVVLEEDVLRQTKLLFSLIQRSDSMLAIPMESLMWHEKKWRENLQP